MVSRISDGADLFTVAELAEPILTYMENYVQIYTVSWKVLSISTAQLAEVGIKGSWSAGNPPIGLF
jgi:hypothetical protein